MIVNILERYARVWVPLPLSSTGPERKRHQCKGGNTCGSRRSLPHLFFFLNKESEWCCASSAAVPGWCGGWHWGPFSVEGLARPQGLGRFISAVSRGSAVFASSLEKVYPRRWETAPGRAPQVARRISAKCVWIDDQDEDRRFVSAASFSLFRPHKAAVLLFNSVSVKSEKVSTREEIITTRMTTDESSHALSCEDVPANLHVITTLLKNRPTLIPLFMPLTCSEAPRPWPWPRPRGRTSRETSSQIPIRQVNGSGLGPEEDRHPSAFYCPGNV